MPPGVENAEVSFLDGVDSNLQSQIDALASALATKAELASGAGTPTRIPVFDAEGALGDSAISQTASEILLLDKALAFSGNVAMPVRGFWQHSTSGHLGVGGSNSFGVRFVVSSAVVANLSTLGLAVGTSTSNSARRIESLDTSGYQYRATHTAGSIYTDFGTDANGYFTIAPTGNRIYLMQSTWPGHCFYGSSGQAGGGFQGNRGLSVACGHGYELTLYYSSTKRIVMNSTGIGFFNRTPAASQELLAALVDSTGGSAQTTLGAPPTDTVANLAAYVADLAATVASYRNSDAAKLVATTLVTQAS